MRETKPTLSARASSGHESRRDGDACLAQAHETATGDERVGIFHGCEDARDASGDERVRARRRAADVAARFEGHVHGRAAHVVPSLARVAQRLDLGMSAPWRLRRAFTEHHVVPDDHAADAWIGVAAPQRILRAKQRAVHPR